MGNIRMNSPAYKRDLAMQEMRNRKRKAQAKRERLQWVFEIILAIIIGILVGLLTGCGNNSVPEATVTNANVEAIVSDDAIINPLPTSPVTVADDEPTVEVAHEAPSTAGGSWQNSTTSHDDINVNTILKNKNKDIIFNFNDTVAVGIYAESGLVSTVESESGFILSVIDNDSVKVTFYNNGIDYIKPVKVTAEMADTDYIDESGDLEYVISGYNTCSNGLGIIEMTLSNGNSVKAGVLSENGQLYAANAIRNENVAKNVVSFREKMTDVLAEANIRPDNSTYTDPIYYPIVPVNPGEKTDVDFWVNKSNEITEPDWTDAHKVLAIYDYVIHNCAYDYWVISKGVNSRTFYYEDFSDKYYISNTNVGVCHDFANIIAIMCRAQGIPATKLATKTHAWNYIYIADYNRWISVDATGDMIYGCRSEDYTDWYVAYDASRYAHVDNISGDYLSKDIHANVGNEKDMETYNIPIVEP